MPKDLVILGIDPGTNIMGYGAIHVVGHNIKLLGAGVISMQKLEDHSLKLKKIFEGTSELIKQFNPDELAIEAPFFGKNVQSMLKLGRAQGIAIAAALVRNIPVFEYSPKKIKLAVTGNGNASKEQVAGSLKSILQFDQSPHYLDSTDALGAALCHHLNNGKEELGNKNRNSKKKKGAWETFLKENPGRKLD